MRLAPVCCILLVSLDCLAHVAIAQPDVYRQSAPPEAFEEGSSLAYFGSENEWGPRQFTAQQAQTYYKRRGQRHMLLIMEGRAEEAAQSCREYLQKDPADLESLFNLCVAQCQLGDVVGAFSTMKQAVAAGLPIERFVVGPRSLLTPLTDSTLFRNYLTQHLVTILHGPMLGAMTDTSVRVWLRTAEECVFTVRVFERESESVPLQVASAKTSKQNDYTGIAEITGLKPDTNYVYDLLIDGIAQNEAARYSFRTFPLLGKAARFRIAFGGCAGFAPQNERMWDTIRSFEPVALLLLGDNVYIDLPREAGPLHHYTYYQRQSRPEFRRLISSVPVFATWDDHDAAVDDVWLGPYRDKPSWKPSMLELQKQNWNNPAYGDPQWPGCWFRFSVGDVDFFVLDCRYYRTNPFADSRTMLGPVQKKWLLDELARSKATFKVIASSVAWASGAKPGSHDTWDGFSKEREEIFSWIEQGSIDGVVLLSSDRHRSEAWRIPRPNGYPLYDFLSGRLTNVEVADLVPGTLFDYNDKCSFGLLSFDTTCDDPQVTYEIVNIDGQSVHSLTLNQSSLSFPSHSPR